MPNEKNLIPNDQRTPEERRQNAQKAGIASGVSRRRKRSLKEAADLYLSLPVSDRRVWNKTARRGVDHEDIDKQMAMVIGLTVAATAGDAKAAKIIVENGGQEFEKDGERWFRINTAARFVAPLEFCVGPNPRIVVGEKVDYDFACVTNRGYSWKMTAGQLPKGLRFKGGRLSGVASEPGD